MKRADAMHLKRAVCAADATAEAATHEAAHDADTDAANQPACRQAGVAAAAAAAAVDAAGTTDGAAPRRAALRYYEAIEHASADMLTAARGGDWDSVVKLEGACALLISQLKHAAAREALDGQGAALKSVIMQRILLNDAEIRHLAEPWLDDLDRLLAGRSKTLH